MTGFLIAQCNLIVQGSLTAPGGDPTGLSSTWGRLAVLGVLLGSLAVLIKAWRDQRRR